MTVPYDIGTFLESKNMGTLGSTIFINVLPDNPDACIGVFQYAGSSPLSNIAVERPAIQVRVRGGKGAHQTAAELADSIIKALHGIRQQKINNVKYKTVTANGSAMVMGVDGLNRIELSCNFTVIKDL